MTTSAPYLRRSRIPLVGSVLMLLLAALPVARSLNVTDSLNVQGSTNLNIVTNSTNAAIGSLNHIDGGVSSSLIVGSSNYLVAPAVGTIVTGTGNAIETATKSAVFGKDNYVSGSQSLTAGTLHFVEGSYGFAYGFTNAVGPTATSAMAGGQLTNANGVASASLGSNTVAHSFASTAIGQYNAKASSTSDEDINIAARTTWRGQDTLFVVGNGTGTSSAQRSNAFLVKKDGTIIIKKQGDIPMTGFESQ